MIVQGVLASAIEGFVARVAPVMALRIMTRLFLSVFMEYFAYPAPIVVLTVVLVEVVCEVIISSTTNGHDHGCWECSGSDVVITVWLSCAGLSRGRGWELSYWMVQLVESRTMLLTQR